MMYHAESFASNKFLTYLVGYGGSQPIPSLLAAPNVSIIHLTDPPQSLRKLPFLIGGPLKVLRQILEIVYTLAVHVPDPPEFILVQNPPSIPTLAIVWLVSKMRGCKVIIDWHNLGFSILALRLGNEHPFVTIAKWFESYFGRSAYAHLFVTTAMHDYLVREWDLQGLKVVLHDRPPSRFHRADPSETHELFQRLSPVLTDPLSGLTSFLPNTSPPYSTPFTHIPPTSLSSSGAACLELGPYVDDIAMPSLRPDRPALIVSSTSWTPDEDFGMLLAALKEYDRRARTSEEKGEGVGLPKVLAIVTGKGPLKEKYMQEVQRLQAGHGGGEDGETGPWRFVRCVSLWLEADDYPLLLGSADIGISLHSSSSALDLPMKVVDMFGCGLPVCALGFDCLDELVKDGVNGLVFHNAEQLAAQIESLLRGFPSAPALAALRASFDRGTSAAASRGRGREVRAEEWQWGTWAENWDHVMRPVLLTDVASEAQL
ncbi:beta-1,4-mannosyltransferase [Dichomitus squalens LYAD-421 SS1]|uniref:Chitobiosyldiphosphodolichol beta-mannosyltransferase n=2 Tax=Dichomitus squalens TaxID=114155 RepID=A0A4Q9MB28_9APHY|nr:beta-1,4-mannosyltransferase [Dichomitus squalens LYAD-421 SS1]EJF58563.1 beta-1,4-mannosyltransferase [Dichomitus squalens LYAD-421 SS1]TBU23112.1 beta-1,4-mannosyltransferase [Dichomitus squalens]